MTVEMRHGDECPKCSGFLSRTGPRGGISQNMECVGCKCRFNVSHMHGTNEVLVVVEEI